MTNGTILYAHHYQFLSSSSKRYYSHTLNVDQYYWERIYNLFCLWYGLALNTIGNFSLVINLFFSSIFVVSIRYTTQKERHLLGNGQHVWHFLCGINRKSLTSRKRIFNQRLLLQIALLYNISPAKMMQSYSRHIEALFYFLQVWIYKKKKTVSHVGNICLL